MDRGLQQHPPLGKTSLAIHPRQQPIAEEETATAIGSARTWLPRHLAAVAVAAAPERPARMASLCSEECRLWASIRLRRSLGDEDMTSMHMAKHGKWHEDEGDLQDFPSRVEGQTLSGLNPQSGGLKQLKFESTLESRSSSHKK